MGRALLAAGAAALVLGAAGIADDGAFDAERLNAIIDARSDEDKARDGARHPAETLEFFGIAPDMVVVETLPGRGVGWYTRILAPYLAPDGALYGEMYTVDRFEKILGDDFTEEFGQAIASFPETFPAAVAELPEHPATAGGFIEGAAPEELAGAVDALLYIRALHHFNRYDTAEFEAETAYAFSLVKPGGVVGVVQHRAQPDADDEWADGNNGYLKESRVIEAFTAAGFVLEESSDVNANDADRPTTEEFVWRLPPTFALGDDNREAYAAIGESDRMTLRFRKPE